MRSFYTNKSFDKNLGGHVYESGSKLKTLLPLRCYRISHTVRLILTK